MPKIKTALIILFSLLAGLMAVKAVQIMTREPAPVPVQPEKTAPVSRPAQESVRQPFSSAVPSGKRIVSMKVDEVSGATRALEKNDRVDVIAVTDILGSHGGKIARVVLQNVIIYDIEQAYYQRELTDRITQKKKNWTLQLLVSLEQAVTLTSVDEAARLRLVLRNREDLVEEPAAPVMYMPDTGVMRQDGRESGLTGLIQPGMRAISLSVENSDGICGRLTPGDRVDIMVSFRLSMFAADEGNRAKGTRGTVTSHQKSSKIILQDIMVISTDQPVNPLTGNQKASSQVSLMVTPSQAEKLAVIADASKSSQIRLILRNPGDHRHVATGGELFSEQVLAEKRTYKVVETIKGTRVHPQKFYDRQ